MRVQEEMQALAAEGAALHEECWRDQKRTANRSMDI